MNYISLINAINLKPVDWIFLSCFVALVVILIIFLIIRKIQESRTNKIFKEEFNKLAQNDVVEQNEETDVVLEEKGNADEVAEEAVNNVVVTNSDESLEVEDTVEVVEEEKPAEVEAESTEKIEEQPEVEEVETSNETEEAVEEQPEEEKKGRVYTGKYEIFKENNYFRYRLKASNGEILFVSEMYNTRLTVAKAIENLKKNLEVGKIEIFADKKKNYKFKLTASNNRVMAISANYSTEKGAQSALESFKRFAMTEEVVDIELPAEQIDSQLVEITKLKEEDKKGGKFLLKRDDTKEFSWELKANNGEILCQNSGYSSKTTVENAILAFKENVNNGKFYLSKDKSNNYQFKLYSQSGRLSNIGESYDSSNAVYSVVTSILNFVTLATISDTTKAPAAKPGQKRSLKKTNKK